MAGIFIRVSQRGLSVRWLSYLEYNAYISFPIWSIMFTIASIDSITVKDGN